MKFHLAEASLTLIIIYYKTCMYCKDKTYLPTLLEPLCRYPVVSHLFVLGCMLQQGDNAGNLQSPVSLQCAVMQAHCCRH